MAVFDKLRERIAEKAERVVDGLLDGMERAVAEFPDVEVVRERGDIVIRGRGLMRRVMTDVRLRFALRGLK